MKSKRLSIIIKMLIAQLLRSVLGVFSKKSSYGVIDRLTHELAEIKVDNDKLVRAKQELKLENEGLEKQLASFTDQIDLSEIAKIKKNLEMIDEAKVIYRETLEFMEMLDEKIKWESVDPILREIKASLSQCKDNFQKIKVLRKKLPALKTTPLWEYFEMYTDEKELKKVQEIEVKLNDENIVNQKLKSLEFIDEEINTNWEPLMKKWRSMNKGFVMGGQPGKRGQ